MIPSRTEMNQAEVKAWSKKPVFPNGIKNWEGFFAFCTENAGKVFVAKLSLLDSPARLSSISHVFLFGVMHTLDGKFIGTNCLSKGFCDKGVFPGIRFHITGLDQQELGIYPSPPFRKIEFIEFDPAKVISFFQAEIARIDRSLKGSKKVSLEHICNCCGYLHLIKFCTKGFSEEDRATVLGSLDSVKNNLMPLLDTLLSDLERQQDQVTNKIDQIFSAREILDQLG
jgi:hypothetical protein